jgi:hypothetical protein
MQDIKIVLQQCTIQGLKNNQSGYGATANVESGSSIKFYDWYITEGIAAQSGVIQASNNGYFEFHGWTLVNNYAYTVPISEIFNVQNAPIINNSTLQNNVALTLQTLGEEYAVQCKLLWFLSNAWVLFFNSNKNVFLIIRIEHGIEVINGALIIENNTQVINHPQFLSSYESSVSLKDVTFSDISTEESIISVLESQLVMENIKTSNLTSSSSGIFISVTQWNSAIIDGINLANSCVKLLRSSFSFTTIQNSIVEDMSIATNIMSFSHCYECVMSNMTIENMSIGSSEAVYIFSSHFSSISDFSISNIDKRAITVYNSELSKISNLTIYNATQGMECEQSALLLLENSDFTSWGTTDIISGGAINLIDSIFTIVNTIFEDNTAVRGGAIWIEAELLDDSQKGITGNQFINNKATVQGGALFYNQARPEIVNNIYESNSAEYGPNIGSYAVGIVEASSQSQEPLILNNVASGIKYNSSLILSLVDYENQQIIFDEYNHVSIESMTTGATIYGTKSVRVSNGVATFDELTFSYEPGATNVHYIAKSIQLDQITNSNSNHVITKDIYVNFRFWEPGEIKDENGKCSPCPTGTYSLDWNSTKWSKWTDHSTCYGGNEIRIDNGFWRKSITSTNILEWPRRASCKGGFNSENTSPVECRFGYTGPLCLQCSSEIDYSYVRDYKYTCAKCSKQFINILKYLSICLFVLLFIITATALVYKFNGTNELPVLIRIMMNYLQSVTIVFWLGLNFPDYIHSIFIPFNLLGASTDSFLNIDWFYERAELKGFTPSNEIFKVFLTSIAPALLVLLLCIVLIPLFLFYRKTFEAVKQQIMIIVLWVMMYVYPTIARHNLGLFEWTKIGNDTYGMTMHLDYKWYSLDHFYWIMFLAVPSLIIWGIVPPVFWFFVVWQNKRHKLKNPKQNVWRILHQGYK